MLKTLLFSCVVCVCSVACIRLHTGCMLSSCLHPLAYWLYAFQLLASACILVVRFPVACIGLQYRTNCKRKKLHQYFLGDSAPFRIERDFRTMQLVFYGDFVPMGYVCIVPLWGWCDKTMYLHCRG